jgi:putative transposase
VAQAVAGMSVDGVKRLRLLEQENMRLKKILAERDLEMEDMKVIASEKW